MIPVEPTAGHKVPFDLSDEEPATHKDGVAVAVNTVDLIAQLGGGLDFDNNDLDKAQKLVLGQDKPNTPKHVTSSGEAAAAHSIIKQFDFTAFNDALQARNYITNKLVSLSNCGDPKLELKALELLGKHSDIGLFTERSEVTITHTTSEALEKSIKERVKRLLNADATDVTPRLIDELDEVAEVRKAEKAVEKTEAQPEQPEQKDA